MLGLINERGKVDMKPLLKLFHLEKLEGEGTVMGETRINKMLFFITQCGCFQRGGLDHLSV